jgi:hypothetical protein
METKKKAGRPRGSKNKQSTKKHTRSELIRKYATTFPDAKPIEIARYYGYPVKLVYQVLWAWRKKNAGITPAKYVHEVTKEEIKAHIEHVELHKELTKDMVNNPPHYTQGGIETIDFIEAKELSYNLGNVVKYITRSDHKGNKVEDLMKARWYLDREITNLTPPLA